MSSVLNNQKLIQEERMSTLSKSITKQKKRNQYTIEFKFGSEIDISKLQSGVEIVQRIPQCIPQNIIFRLESNIQFPLFIDTQETLGCLAIDPHSYNYKVVRYDKIQGKHIFHCEPIQRSFTPYKLIRDILFKYNNIMGDSFEQFHQQNLLIKNYNIVSEEIIENYEKSLNQPYALYIQRIKDATITTLAKVINDKYLELMGVNEEMLRDYIVSADSLPWFFANTNLQWNEIVTDVFFGNARFKANSMLASNFNGKQLLAEVIISSFHLFDQSDNSYIQYIFYSFPCRENLTSIRQIEENCTQYFNRKPSFKEVSEKEALLRCKFRNLLMDKTLKEPKNQNLVLLKEKQRLQTSSEEN